MSINCRICLKTEFELCSIYTFKSKEYLPHVIYNISGVKVSQKSEPAAKICRNCATALLIAQKIILRCQESEEYLMYQRLHATTTKSQQACIEKNEINAKEQNLSYDFETKEAIEILDKKISEKHAHCSDNESTELPQPLREPASAQKSNEDIETPAKRVYRCGKKATHFQCDQCDYSNKVGKRLIEHKSKEHNIFDPNIYACNFCTQRFSWRPTLHRHIQVVHKTLPADKKYICDECGRAYMRKVHLMEHTKQRHGPRSFKCPDPDCEQTFARAFTLRRHYITAHTEPTLTRYHCVDCDKYFKIYDLWKYHNEIVHKNEIVYCPRCGYPFRFKKKLNEHMLKDVCKRSIIPCAYCQRRFTTKTGLKDHMRNQHRL